MKILSSALTIRMRSLPFQDTFIEREKSHLFTENNHLQVYEPVFLLFLLNVLIRLVYRAFHVFSNYVKLHEEIY